MQLTYMIHKYFYIYNSVPIKIESLFHLKVIECTYVWEYV